MAETTHLICAHCGADHSVSNIATPENQAHLPLSLNAMNALIFSCDKCAVSYPLYANPLPTQEAVERARHDTAMESNAVYADRMNKLMLTPGKTVTIVFDVKDGFGTLELMHSLYSKSDDPELVAGGVVTKIAFKDSLAELAQIKYDVEQVLKGSLTSILPPPA